MNRVRRYIAAAAVVLAALPCGTSCFKKVSHDTRIILRPNLQSESGGTLVVAQGVEAYACNKGELWFVRSYDDAVNRVVTNTTDGSIATLNDVVEAQPYERNGVEGLLSMRTKWAHVMMVAVYPAAKMYAWRHYATAENLPETWIAFQFRPWKSSGYVDGEWHVEFAERDEDNGDNEENNGFAGNNDLEDNKNLEERGELEGNNDLEDNGDLEDNKNLEERGDLEENNDLEDTENARALLKNW